VTERSYPVLRIDDYKDAVAFYVDYLGFEIEFEWRHEPGFPVYMGLMRGGLGLHVTEHRGDLEGGGGAHFHIESVPAFYEEIKARRPEMEEVPIEQKWGSTEIKLKDPFGNGMVFASATA
jgi:uncharacterized glyoxalase superfamily protein PhnB